MKIIVSGDYYEELRIQFSQGTWHVTLYTLYENRSSISVDLPRDASLYRITIFYDAENYYFENLLYVSNPNLDTLKFHFYKENARVFCKVESEIVLEFNKEIILNPLPESLKELKKIIDNFQDDDCASL